jgi:hypothetical protein
MSADDIEVGFILYFFFIVFDVATVNLSTCASPTNDAHKSGSQYRCCRGRDRMVVGFTTTYAISAYHY